MRARGQDPDWNRLSSVVVTAASTRPLPDVFAQWATLASARPALTHSEQELTTAGQYWHTSLLPLQDQQAREIGQILLLVDTTPDHAALNYKMILWITGSVVLMIVLTITAYLMIDHTGQIINKTANALENERLALRTLIDNIPDSIYMVDLSYRKTLANRAEVRFMGARSEAEVIGKDDFEIYPRELAEKFYADNQSVFQTGSPIINREEFIFDEQGQKRWLLTSKFPLRDRNNQHHRAGRHRARYQPAQKGRRRQNCWPKPGCAPSPPPSSRAR